MFIIWTAKYYLHYKNNIYYLTVTKCKSIMNRKTYDAEMMTKSNVLLLLIIHSVHLNSNYYDIKIKQVQNAVMIKLMHRLNV